MKHVRVMKGARPALAADWCNNSFFCWCLTNPGNSVAGCVWSYLFNKNPA